MDVATAMRALVQLYMPGPGSANLDPWVMSGFRRARYGTAVGRSLSLEIDHQIGPLPH